MSNEFSPATLDLLALANVDELRMRAGKHDHPKEYVHSLVRKYNTHSLYTSTLFRTGAVLEPFTNASDRRKLLGMKTAFLAGNLLAVEVVDITGGEELLAVMPGVTMNFNVPPGKLSPSDLRKFVSAQLYETSMEAYKVATIFHPLIDKWGYKLAHRKHQESLRTGFGMVLNLGKTAIDQLYRLDHSAFEAEAANGIDWDATVHQLLGEES